MNPLLLTIISPPGNQGYSSGDATNVDETDIINSTYRLIGVSPLEGGTGGTRVVAAAASDDKIGMCRQYTRLYCDNNE